MADDRSQGGKVHRVMQKWGLGDVGVELERRWVGDGREDQSLRELTEYFNKEVFRKALTDHGTVPLEGEVDNFFHLLTGDDVTKADKIQAEQRLRETGLDPDELQADTLSHQTMYRYLQQHRGVQKSTPDKSTDELVETVQRASARLTNRLKSVVRHNLETLNGRSGFHVGDFDVYVDVRVSCSECNATRDLTQLLERDGCECR